MSNEKKDTEQPIPPATFVIKEPAGGALRLYANVSHVIWSGMDLTVQLYQLDQPNRDLAQYKYDPNVLHHTADVTLTWAAAKMFQKALEEILERYEKAYGETINTQFKNI